MSSVPVFAGAALPWIAAGLLIALLFARTASKRINEEKKEDYSSEGMLLGLAVGSAKEKKDDKQ